VSYNGAGLANSPALYLCIIPNIMANENNFYIGSDSLSTGVDIDSLAKDIEKLQARKIELSKKLAATKEANSESGESSTPRRKKEDTQPTLWDAIDAELEPLSESQYKLLTEDETYKANAAELDSYMQEAILYLTKPIVESTVNGKKMLEAQLSLIKGKKQDVINRSNKELEMFEAFKRASANDPDLSYSQFLKTYNEQ